MLHRDSVISFSGEELQRRCDACRAAIESQDNTQIRRAMQQICDHCSVVRGHIPVLSELRRHIHEMSEKRTKVSANS